MHAFIIVPIAQQAAANQAALTFDPNGSDTFSILLYGVDATDDSSPVSCCCAPEFATDADLQRAELFQAAFPGCTFLTYDIAAPNPIPAALAQLGLRFALQKLPF